MLERGEGFVDRNNKHHKQEIQGIDPHVSDRPSDQSTELGHLSHLDFHYRISSQPSSVD
jgi:hypothetical protein